MRELRRPIGFCNPYFDSFTPLSDIAEAAAMVDAFDLAPLHIRGSAVSMEVTRGFADDVVVGRAGAAPRARRARRCRCGWRCAAAAAASRTLTVRVPVPAGLRPGVAHPGHRGQRLRRSRTRTILLSS